MEHIKHTIISYKTNLVVLFLLLVLTGLSVAIANFNLGEATIWAAMLLATLKVTFVFAYFMHLKYESKFLQFIVIFVLILLVSVLLTTLIDYNYR